MPASLFDRLLNVPFIRRSRVASYVVRYSRDKGVLRTLLKMGRILIVKGPSAVFRPQGIVLNKLWIEKVAEIESREAHWGAMDQWTTHPLISIVVPVYNTPGGALKKMIDSVIAQVYPNWELCIADDCSTQPGIRQVLDVYAHDPRIKVTHLEKNGGISAATNQAITISTGKYLGLLDHDDELTKDALYWVVEDLNRRGSFDILYTDECKTDENGVVDSEVFYKPDWSPELLFSQMYAGHFSVYRKAFLDETVGYFRSQYDFSQDYDLFLRASAKTNSIRHVQKVLYKWRKVTGSAAQGDKGFARKSNIAALAAAIRERGIHGEALALPQGNRVRVAFDQNTLVSVILSPDVSESAERAIDDVIGRTIYPNYEVVVAADQSLVSAIKKRHPGLVYALLDKPYTTEDARNAGAAVARGEVVVFLSGGLRPLGEDWLVNLVEWLWTPGVGAVSPRLLYENGTIRYAGGITGVRGLVGTAFHTYTADTPAQFSFPKIHRNVSVLSGQCLAMRRSFFLELDGFVPGAHNHTDLSFRILERGQRLVFTAYSDLRQTARPVAASFSETGRASLYLIQRWARYLGEDPYFTRPMRDLLYLDSPEPFAFYPPLSEALPFPGRQLSSSPVRPRAILLAAPDLAGGVSGMLLDVARLLSDKGYFVVVAAVGDGPLRTAFGQAGFSVLVDALLFSGSPGLEALAGGFDGIVCCSAAGWPLVQDFQDRVPTIWVVPALPGTAKKTRHLIVEKDVERAKIALLENIAENFSIPTFAD